MHFPSTHVLVFLKFGWIQYYSSCPYKTFSALTKISNSRRLFENNILTYFYINQIQNIIDVNVFTSLQIKF